jgi:hypothetical protein
MEWLKTRGREVVSLLADLGGALAFVVIATTFIVAAVTGAALGAWTAFPQPYFTILVVGMALLAGGLVLHLLRDRLRPPPRPQAVLAHGAGTEPPSQAAALRRRHETEEAAKKARDRQLRERRALGRIREELLDNKRVLPRLAADVNELLSLNFTEWHKEKTVLLELEDIGPYSNASAAYRELQALGQGRVSDDGFSGELSVYGEPPDEAEISAAERAIDEAVAILQ